MSRQPSSARMRILEVLAARHRDNPARKALEHPKGRVVEVLLTLIDGDTSHDALTQMLSRLHQDGFLIRQTVRDPGPEGGPARSGKRTYSLDITEAGLDLVRRYGARPATESLPVAPHLAALPSDPGPIPVARDAGERRKADDPELAPEGMDYDLLSRAVLKIVFNNLTASDEVAELRTLRQRVADLGVALTEAQQVIAAQGEQLAGEREVRLRIEAEAEALSLEVEALRQEIAAVRDTPRIDTARTRGWELRDIASEKSLNALNELMRSLPSTRD